MRPEIPNEADGRLRETLRQWKIDEPLPPGFRERVWRRIERRAAPTATGWRSQFWHQLCLGLARPKLALGYVAALLLVGLLAGSWQARTENPRAAEQFGLRYVQMMDPYQMPGH